MKIRIATWNIAAARRMLSLDRFDYSEQAELDYFAGQLHKLNPNVICLQESEAKPGDSLSEHLAGMLNMPYCAETRGCPSHIDHDYQLTTAIISKQPFSNPQPILLPHPTFELRFKHNGRVVPPYDRYAQTVSFGGFTIANVHTEPLGAFGLEYEAGEGHSLAQAIDSLLTKELGGPLIFAADFNMHNLGWTLPSLLKSRQLQEALPDEPTKPHGSHPDHILFSPEWHVTDAGIEHTQTDHYLCWADLELQA